jgi:hypothetical protein
MSASTNLLHVREHVAYDCLAHHRAAVDFSAHARRLADVTAAQIDAMAASWPDELEPHRARFAEFLKHRRVHALDIAQNAATLLGAP